MNVFVTSLSLVLIGIAMILPVFFMPIAKQIQKGVVPRRVIQNSYIIHLIAGIIAVGLYWIYGINAQLQIASMIYLITAIVVVLFYWNAELTKWNLFTATLIFGFIVFYRSINEIVEITPLWPGILTGLLTSAILGIIILLLIMFRYDSKSDTENNLLEKGLVKYLFALLGIRIFWGIVILFNLSVATRYGDVVSALKYFWQADQIRLLIVIIMEMLVPIFYMVTLRSKILNVNTKYRFIMILILFVSIITAEFMNKYFLLQFGIVL